MFATVATTAMVRAPQAQNRGRAVSVLLISETSGLFLGSVTGGWLYQGVNVASPFLFEAACMVIAAIALGRWASLTDDAAPERQARREKHILNAVLRPPGVFLMGMTNAVLTAIQTGVLVFLFPLYLVKRGGLGPELVGLLVSLSVLGRLMALWVGGTVSDKWGRMRALIPGLLVYAFSLASMSQLTQPAILAVCSLAVGAAAGFVAAIPTALTSDQVERPLQGVAIGWLRTMSDSGQIAGPLLMGALADAIDLSAPFLVGAALLTVVAWRCRSRANAMTANVVTEGRDS
jgi:MFS family permease